MAVSSFVWPNNKDLMVTHTDKVDKILHKVGTEDYYDDPIDLIAGFIEDGPRKGQPYCRFEYEEVDRPVVEGENVDERTDNDNQEEA